MTELKFPSTSASKTAFLKTKTNKFLLVFTIIMAVVYFVVLAFWFPKGNPVLFYLLVAGELFHLWQAFAYIHTVWDTDHLHFLGKKHKEFYPQVDVFITVAGEPVEIVEATARAAMEMEYPNFQVFLLNDGKVAHKANWKEIEFLAKRLGIHCITREIPGGAKAGNINHALTRTGAPFFALFDADQEPRKDFLKELMGYFQDPLMGFVQTPQYYKNYGLNEVTKGSWEQQELFFGPICKGKNRYNAAFMCGTNMIVRKSALLSAGGMNETNIAEDFLTSLYVHQKGWKSVYVAKVLAEGLAPQDFLSYYNQQMRWARGSLEMVFWHNPLFKKGLTLNQRIQYLASATYYLSGLVVLLNALLPLIFFYTGLVPLQISTMTLAAVFFPYIISTIMVLKLSSNYGYTFKALSFSMGSFGIQAVAAVKALFNRRASFVITSKKQLQGNFLRFVVPHISYLLLALIGLEIAVLREGFSAALFTNLAWAMFNVSVFAPFVLASLPKRSKASPGVAKEAGIGVPVPAKVPIPRISILERFSVSDLQKRK